MSTELKHHGIKGQKWGVRRFQNKDGSRTAAGKEHRLDTDRHSSDDTKNKGSSYDTKKEGVLKNLIQKHQSKNQNDSMSPNQDGYLGEKWEKKALSKNLAENSVKKVSDLPKENPPTSSESFAKKVNPGYPKSGAVDNCTMCTAAMIAHSKHGVSVEACHIQAGISDPAEASFYKPPESYLDRKNHTTFSAPSGQAFDVGYTLSKMNKMYGPNRYGEFAVYWIGGGGHSMYWETDSHGKATIYDSQSGQKYTANSKKTMEELSYWTQTVDIWDATDVELSDSVCGAIKPRKRG